MTSPLRILHLEDDPNDMGLAQAMLEADGIDCTMARVDTRPDFLAAIEQGAFDLILADYSMPSFDGLSALEIARQERPEVPFIFVSGTLGEEVATETLKNGATDYVLKHRLSRLAPSVRRALRQAEESAARRQAEQARQDSERRFRAMIEKSGDGIALTSADGAILYASPAATRILGYSTDELVGTNPFALLHPEDVPPATALFGQILREPGASATRAVRVRHKDGSCRWLEFIGTNLLAESGVQAIVVNFRDISERRRAEEEIRRRLAELEAVNRISTAMRAAQTLDEMLPLLLGETLAVLDTDTGAIWLHDETGADELRPTVSRGWHALMGDGPIRPGEGIAGAVFATGVAYVSREFVTDPLTSDLTRPLIPAGWGGACIPIRTAHQIVGVLFVSAQLPRAVTADEVNLLTTLAEIAGNAIHRMRLHEQTEQHLKRLAALRAIDIAISSSLDLRVALNVLLEEVVNQLRVDAADVLLLNPDMQTLKYAAGRGFRNPAIMHTPQRLGQGHTGRGALERRTIFIPNLRESEKARVRTGMLTEEGFVSYYGVPLIAKGQIKGVLEVFQRSLLPHDQDWLAFLEALAGEAAIAIDNAELFGGLQRSNLELTLAYDTTLEGWSYALDLRDKETEGHTRRVTDLTVRLARAMGIGETDLVHVRRGALLHDIGKMGVPDSILLKPGPLADDEWEIMRRHPAHAHDMLSPIAYLRPALDIPYCHHEKWDGSGYPRGWQGERIPLAARIFAVVDVWDALHSDRPYRPAWPEEAVREHVRSLAGTHLDPKVVEAFLQMELE